MADPDNRVELTDLDVISRYSLAVRAATADRHELIATLRADLEWLQGGRARRTSSASTPARSAPEPEVDAEDDVEVAAEPARKARTSQRRSTPDRRAPAVKKATAKKAVSSRAGAARKPAPTKSTAKKTSAKKTSAKKTPARKSAPARSTAKKSPAKKSPAKKSPARKTAKSPRTTVRWG